MSVIDISSQELKRLLKNNWANVEIIDVREPHEWQVIHLKNSKLIPMNELEKRSNEIDWHKKVVFLCRSGYRSKLMADIISASTNHEVNNLRNGIYDCYMDKEKCLGNLVVDESKVKNYF
jgi:rhodanese-related sulfurtransferase